MKRMYRSLGIVLLASLFLTACVAVTPAEEEAYIVPSEIEQANNQMVMHEAWDDSHLDDLAAGQIAMDGSTLVADMTAADYEAIVQQHYLSIMEAAWEKANLDAFAEGQLCPVEGKGVEDLTHTDYHALAQR